ncbi:MAG: NYN domain-containing protein [Alphaproteobacteria bacterium]|nr:NYN domain-containing protein [Alphaproteobacteria bacterium]
METKETKDASLPSLMNMNRLWLKWLDVAGLFRRFRQPEEGPCPDKSKRVNVYVDLLNMIMIASGKPWLKWFDGARLFRRFLRPGEKLCAIHWFYSVGNERRAADEACIDTLMKANICHTGHAVRHIHTLGGFMPKTRPTKLADPRHEKILGRAVVDVSYWSEKCTDINLATGLVADAYEDLFDTALLVTNDSDQVATVSTLKRRPDKNLRILTPVQENGSQSKDLFDSCHDVQIIRQYHMADSQLPTVVRSGAEQIFRRPDQWTQYTGGATAGKAAKPQADSKRLSIAIKEALRPR